MQKRILYWQLGLGIVLAVLGLAWADRALATWLDQSALINAPLLQVGTRLLDFATGKEVSKFLLGGSMLLASLALLALKLRRAGWILFFTASVQLLSTLLTGIAKPLFGRLRPFELLGGGEWNQAWFAGGGSFPSGHAGFYFGLFLPLATLFPRWRWPLLAVPWFVAIARVDANDHFLSDVAVSIVVAALLTLAASKLMATRLQRAEDVDESALGDELPRGRP